MYDIIIVMTIIIIMIKYINKANLMTIIYTYYIIIINIIGMIMIILITGKVGQCLFNKELNSFAIVLLSLTSTIVRKTTRSFLSA